MTVDHNSYKSKNPPDPLHVQVKLTTEAERQEAETASPERDVVEESVKALNGGGTPAATPVNVEFVQDDTYHQIMDGLRVIERLADRDRHVLTVDEVRQMQATGSPWMTYKEVAEYLSVAVGTVRNWVSARKIPFVKRGGMVRFKRAEIDAWLVRSRKSGTGTT